MFIFRMSRKSARGGRSHLANLLIPSAIKRQISRAAKKGYHNCCYTYKTLDLAVMRFHINILEKAGFTVDPDFVLGVLEIAW